MKEKGIPGYLKKSWTENRWRRRYRLREEVREGMYWGKEENRLCRVCGVEREIWEHVWEECGGGIAGGSWQGMVR